MAQQSPPTSLSSPLLPDFHVSVVVEGKPAPLYAIKQEGNKVTCFVESKESASFEVHCQEERAEPPSHAYQNDCYIDGRKLPYLCDGRTPFLFAKLSTTDQDELACGEEDVVKGMGTIRLQYHRLKSIGESSAYPDKVVPTAAVLHEASKKAQLSHQSQLGAERLIANVKSSNTVKLDPKDSPLVTFQFVYRSRTLLEIEGIIPTPPIAEPVNAERSNKKRPAEVIIDSDSDDEDVDTQLAALRARVAELERKKVKVKADSEPGTKGNVKKEKSDVKRVKREQGGEGGKKGERKVIELD